MIAGALHPDGVALVELALQQLERDRVLQLALDHPLERPGAVDRIVALRGQQLPGLRRHVEAEVPRGQQRLQVPELEVHDPHEILAAQRPEDDDVVHPVEELGPEVIAQLVPHPLLHPVPRRVVRRCRAGACAPRR